VSSTAAIAATSLAATIATIVWFGPNGIAYSLSAAAANPTTLS
jgi:hypothetical protein